jgi:hypothetical protein
MSIVKSQAEALAENFLDSLGEDKSELTPKDALPLLYQLVGGIIDQAQENLIKSNSNANGFLSKSIVADNPTVNGNIVSIDILMLFYGQFINDGVKGTKEGKGKYQFKGEYPSKEMVKNLVKGIGRAKKSTRNVNRNKTIVANEKKNINISDISKAYGAGRNILRYGIKATGFMNDAIIYGNKELDNIWQ